MAIQWGWVGVMLMAVAGLVQAGEPITATTLWADDFAGGQPAESWVALREANKATVWVPESMGKDWGLPARPAAGQTLPQLMAKNFHTPRAPQHVRWAILRCNFPGSPAHPMSPSQILRVFNKPQTGVNAFFDRQSRGRLSMDIAWVEDIQLPRSQPGYWSTLTSLSAFLDTTTGDCVRQAALRHNMDDITGVAVFYNANIDCCAYGSAYQMPVNGDTRDVRAIWIPPGMANQPIVLAHEIAHSFGVPHSNNGDEDWDTTDNAWDLMSNISLNREVDGEIGPLPRSLHPYHRFELGWIDEAELVDMATLDGADRTVEVNLATYQMLRLRLDGNRAMIVSQRPAGIADEGTRDVPAIFIDEFNPDRPQPLWAMDAATPAPNMTSTDTSYFTAGESWQIPFDARQVTVQVMSVSNEGARVRVTLGPPPTIFADTFD